MSGQTKVRLLKRVVLEKCCKPKTVKDKSSPQTCLAVATVSQMKTTKSITLADWSVHSLWLGFPFRGRQPNAVWRWRARRPHTHSALRNRLKVQGLPSLFGSRNSSRRTFRLICTLFWVLSSPRLRGPAALVEELPHKDNVIPQDTLGNPHPNKSREERKKEKKRHKDSQRVTRRTQTAGAHPALQSTRRTQETAP